jgi:hypothetical protein
VTVWKLSGLVRRSVGVLNLAVILKPTRESAEQTTESVVWVEQSKQYLNPQFVGPRKQWLHHKTNPLMPFSEIIEVYYESYETYKDTVWTEMLTS